VGLLVCDDIDLLDWFFFVLLLFGHLLEVLGCFLVSGVSLEVFVLLADGIPLWFLTRSAILLHMAFLSTFVTFDGWLTVGLDLVE
jgi:hypothetical protein